MSIIGRWSWLALLLTVFGCTSFHGSHPDGGGDGPVDKAAGDRPVAPTSDADASEQPTSCAVMTDPKNCGVCGHDCSTLPNVRSGAAVECRSGICWVPLDGCNDGFAHCTALPNEGCETSISRPETCGACGTACKLDAPFCASSGKTQACVATCVAPSPDKCGAKCVDMQTDVANCGSCGSICSFPNADAVCVKGVCTMSKCREGYGDCTAAPGCETPLTTATNCGACGKACTVDHGSAQCMAGTCGPVTCDQGFGNCDTSNPDCETPLTTEAHCGSCAMTCSGAAPLCSTVAGKQTCVSDCAASAPMKCGNKCVDVKTDTNNCGACGMVCSFLNADASCVNGQCVMGACKAGFGDCTNQPGCETPLDTLSNCGRCKNACVFANATSSCDGTKCTTPVCYNGFGNCDSSNPDCETVVNTPNHCGDCTTSCTTATPLCSSSAGKPTCVSDCSASTPTKCGTACVNTATDAQNCGACGKVCSAPNADSACVNGACTFTCKSGFGNCNTSNPDCETPLNTDSNCGVCGKTCTVPNATSSCVGGTCSTPVCNNGYGNCNTSNPDCETPLNTDSNCGVCGKTCAVANASSSCVGGTCSTPVCHSGFANCNTGNPDCETNLNTDKNNCGSCGTACQTCESCQAGVCKNTCASGHTCTNNQCCDSKMGQSCPSGECQTGTYDCNGDCVLKNKTDGVRCGTSDCPAKICQSGVCAFGGINSCPAGQVCTNAAGCILSGRRSKANLPNGQPYGAAQCGQCGSQFEVCCAGRICTDQAAPFCVKSSGEYCSNDPTSGDNSYCENNYY